MGLGARDMKLGSRGSDTITELVSLRPPQYGIPLEHRLTTLSELVPNGDGDVEVGLFSVMPDFAGVGGTECVGSGYARVVHTAWRELVVGGSVARRTNTGTIAFAAVTGDLTVRGWGIWLADNLRAFGLARTVSGTARTYFLHSGDAPDFLDGQLQFGIQ